VAFAWLQRVSLFSNLAILFFFRDVVSGSDTPSTFSCGFPREYGWQPFLQPTLFFPLLAPTSNVVRHKRIEAALPCSLVLRHIVDRMPERHCAKFSARASPNTLMTDPIVFLFLFFGECVIRRRLLRPPNGRLGFRPCREKEVSEGRLLIVPFFSAPRIWGHFRWGRRSHQP